MAVRRVTIAELSGLKSFAHANFVIEYCKDFAPRRAAEASGFDPEYGSKLLDRLDIRSAINIVLERRLEASDINAEWALMEAADNHLIARQAGNINASNAALRLIMQHAQVDAFAAEKVQLNIGERVAERLSRARKLPIGDAQGNVIAFPKGSSRQGQTIDGEVEEVSFI